MADRSSIEWTDATWNPVRGCSIVSPGCTNCYAMRQAHRTSGPGGAYRGLTMVTKGGPVWTGRVRMVPDLYDAPLHWRRPRRVFVNSMSDLFHEKIDLEHIAGLFGIMAMAQQHTFQILTKRPERAIEFFDWIANDADGQTMGCILHARELCGMRSWKYEPMDDGPPWPLPNVWLGVSVEDQKRADERIPLLLQAPAAVRWISAEPLLGPVDLSMHLGMAANHEDLRGLLNWVVVGGESGPGARSFDIAWARSLRDQCRAVGVPFFLKQLGRYPLSDRDEGYPWAELHDDDGAPIGEWGLDGTSAKGSKPYEWPVDLRVREYPA